jgi:hypothetical protein
VIVHYILKFAKKVAFQCHHTKEKEICEAVDWLIMLMGIVNSDYICILKHHVCAILIYQLYLHKAGKQNHFQYPRLCFYIIIKSRLSSLKQACAKDINLVNTEAKIKMSC